MTTPAIDVRLEEGKVYYVIFRFGSAVTPYHLTGNYGDYPDGESYMRRISTNNAMAWRPVGSTDLDLRFNASHLIYRATTTLDSPLTLTTNGAAVVPFEFAQSFTDVADGIYAPIVTVVGTATGGGETFDYHQQVSAATSFVHIDEAPVVTGFTPPSGVPGTVITITGTQIGEAVSVSFNGAKTTPTIISDTTITAVVPVTTTTGRVSVTTLGGTATSEADFTILPTITGFTPTSGTRRTEVKITGSGLAGATAVTFNGEPAEGFRTYVPTEVLALVPDTATTGKITVTTPAGVATSADDFTIDTAISFLSRDYGPVGTSVGLFGTALHQVIAVTFNGTPATFNAVSSVEIRAIVPLGATSGPVAVAGPDGSATSPKDFIVTPAITSIAPIFGQPGDTVAISGTTLDDATAVTFNGLAADFTVVSDVRVDAVVPLGAASGKLAVSTPQGTAVSVMDFTVVPAPATLTVVKETTGGGSADFSFTIVSEGPTREIRRQGAMEGSFASPQYLAIDDDGNVYMTPVFGYGVWKFNACGVYLMHWGTEGSGSGQFNYPMGLAVDRDGNVYVADTYHNRIQKFDRNGVYLTQWGGLGPGNGQFTKPKDVAVDGEGNVYVADTDNYRVQKFDANGTYLDQWGGYGGADGMFARPEGIAVDVEGNVYVSDFYRRTIQKFDGAGSFLGKWGQPGSGPGQFDEPVGIAIDTAGNVYVADRNNHRVQKFDRNGVYLAQWGTLGAALGQFKDPYDVAVDGTGTFYVADKLNSRIQVFTDLGFALGGSSSQTWRLDPARYVITERAAPGWGASSIECDGGSPVTSDRGVSLTLPPGTNVRCTFTSAPLKPPSISGFSPTLGPTGTTVTITGTNLAGVTSVAFNGVPAAQVTFVSDGEITAVVPAGATTGKLSVSNADGAATSEADFVVTHPPAPPSEPEPTTGTAGVKVDALLAWSASDPDDDALTYEVRFGTADPPPTVVAGQSAKTYDPPGDLAYHTTYYWQIVARDEFNERPGQVWSFTTLNRPPAAPANPSPADAAPAQAVTTALAWSGSESDGDALTYEVRFGATNPPPTVVASQSEAAYDPPGDLSPHTIYFWQIVADDGHGGVTSGPVWSFTTLNRPPVAPSGTNPDDAASGVALDTTLAWTGSDPDEDPVTYEVRFGTTNPPSQVVANQSATTYDPPGDLTHHTTYYWQIVARDEHGGETAGPVWRFTTLNRAPAAPGSPSPADGATAQAATTALSWSGSDPDGDALTYEVRFGTANPPPTVVAGQSATTYDPPGNLAAHTTLYWQIVAKDAAHPNGTPGPVWQFTTANTAPTAPSNPTPANGATNVALGTQVCWTAATDPDGDAVTYDVAFGTSNPPPAAATGQSTTCYDPPGDLTAGTPYYWKVTAKDAFGGSAPGSVWSFTTAGGGGTFPDVFYLSPSANVTIGGIAAQGADVLRYTKSINSWAMLFDGSDHGLTKNVSAFTFLDDGSLLFVLAANQTVAGLGTATPYDVVKFTPNTPGVFPLGAGAYDWYFRGRDHFLTTSGEKIDAIDVDGNRLLLSTGGAASVGLASGGTLKAADEDVFVFNVGTNAYESALLIDGSKMPGMAVEDITGIWDDPQSSDYYITIVGAFNLGGVKGNDKSIVKLTPNGGASVYTPSLVSWLASGATLPTGFKIDGLEMAR
ncbi:MAG: IPT/TIG domain-containing protein [Candidatus Promineofilum sp.]|nr:IPT/TIG domain-containing protein [Promineifilum sp.]